VNGKAVPVLYRAFNLIDQTLLWSFGKKDPFSLRPSWTAYDGSPLIDAASDTFVEGSENGILYTQKLNTQYDETKGTLTQKPDPLVKYRYTRPGYANDSSKLTRWYGIENSVVGWRNYAFFTDNGGTLQCVDLNTMKPVYAIDVTDDSDSTMPLEEDIQNNTFYLYTANEMDKQEGQKNNLGKTYVRKIDGLTGKILWQTDPIVAKKTSNDSGGILSSPVLGQGDISNLIIYTMSLVATGTTEEGNTTYGGRIVAYDRNTGKEAWSINSKQNFWSSPLAVYDKNGKSYLIVCERSGEDKNGSMLLYEGSTHKLLYTLKLKGNIEATPAAYGNMLVVGTRGQMIYGISIE
jgi:hypothetical protein